MAEESRKGFGSSDLRVWNSLELLVLAFQIFANPDDGSLVPHLVAVIWSRENGNKATIGLDLQEIVWSKGRHEVFQNISDTN